MGTAVFGVGQVRPAKCVVGDVHLIAARGVYGVAHALLAETQPATGI